ncbi:MAG: amidoligase family protein [Nitratireductor sp.]
MPVFENLVLGFDVVTDDGQPVARCVDDLTITHELDFRAPSKKGWHRIVSDDARLLELVRLHCDPGAEQAKTLAPLASFFKTSVERAEAGMYRVTDSHGRSLAIAASLPGERERVCELITPPFERNHFAQLDALLAPARALGFTVPQQAAVHIHFDAARLKHTTSFCRLVEICHRFGAEMKSRFKANPHCRRVGKVPLELVALVRQPGFAKSGWKPAARQLQALNLSKYSDFNFMNLVHDLPGKDTFEVRILPGSIDGETIAAQAAWFAHLLEWCIRKDSVVPDDFAALEVMLAAQQSS